MTNNEIMISILSAVINGVVVVVFSLLFKKVAEKLPSKKIMFSAMKKFLLFSIRYTLPIVSLIFMFIYFKEVTKWFVFNVVFLFSVLVVNLVTDEIRDIYSMLFEHSVTHRKNNEVLSRMTAKLKEALDDSLSS